MVFKTSYNQLQGTLVFDFTFPCTSIITHLFLSLDSSQSATLLLPDL
jgi:hypothetical protein